MMELTILRSKKRLRVNLTLSMTNMMTIRLLTIMKQVSVMFSGSTWLHSLERDSTCIRETTKVLLLKSSSLFFLFSLDSASPRFNSSSHPLKELSLQLNTLLSKESQLIRTSSEEQLLTLLQDPSSSNYPCTVKLSMLLLETTQLIIPIMELTKDLSLKPSTMMFSKLDLTDLMNPSDMDHTSSTKPTETTCSSRLLPF